VDFTLVGTSVALVFTYAGISISEEGSLLAQALGNLFTCWQDYIFILNGKGAIIKMNPSANRWLKSMHVDEHVKNLNELLQNLDLNSEEMRTENSAGEMDFYLTRGEHKAYYSLNKSAILDRSGREIGAYAIINNVTRYKLLIERVEQTAGIDQLTDLGNRRSYEQALIDLDTPQSLPFSVILGDVNGLKYVNDNMGHAAGDRLLQAIAQGLRDACPKGIRAYRIGGDEFVLLLPDTPMAEAEEVVAAIRGNLDQIGRGLPFEVSIALGIATKEDEDDNLLECIAEADKSMYLNKQNNRRARR
jgi:diguanylate cyclase (GGDEF)-like protein